MFLALAGDWFDFLGLRLVWVRFFPQLDPLPNCRRPSTGLAWLVGIYTAFYGIVSARYESATARIEHRTNAILSLYQTDQRTALKQISKSQESLAPVDPDFLDPITVFRSLGQRTRDEDNVETLKRLAESGVTILGSAAFDLSGADLDGADFSNSRIHSGDFSGANLRRSRFKWTEIYLANFDGADMREAVLDHASLNDVDLSTARLAGVSLIGVRLDRCSRWPAGFDPLNHGATPALPSNGESGCYDGRRFIDGVLVDGTSPHASGDPR